MEEKKKRRRRLTRIYRENKIETPKDTKKKFKTIAKTLKKELNAQKRLLSSTNRKKLILVDLGVYSLIRQMIKNIQNRREGHENN